jgi:hypothetical protein
MKQSQTANDDSPGRHYRRLYALWGIVVALAVVLALCIPDSLYQDRPAIRAFADAVARILPSIDQFAAVSDFPGTTKVVLACLWASVPLLVVLMVIVPDVLRLRAGALKWLGWRLILIFPVLLGFAVLLPMKLKIHPDDLHSGLAVDKYIWFASKSKLGLGLVGGLYCFVAAFSLAAMFILARELCRGAATRHDVTG